MSTSPAKLNAIRQIQAQLARLGRNYRIDLEALDLASLHELQRLLRDLGAPGHNAGHRLPQHPGPARGALRPS